MSATKIFILSLAALSYCDGAKILGVFPMYSYSHYILGNSLFEELARRGHELTVINSYANRTTTNYKSIFLDGAKAHVMDTFKADLGQKDNAGDLENMPITEMILFLYKMNLVIGDYIFNHSEVQAIMNERFDVVIVEQFFNDAMKVFCHHFGAHCIAFSTVGASNINNYLVANPAPASYISDTFLSYSSRMSFVERAHNFLFRIASRLIDTYYFHKQNEQIQQLFPTAPHIYDLMRNVSVLLLNSHISTNQAVPHVPSMVEVGGLHIKPPKKLPTDLQKYLDDAKDGAVYFSLGSTVRSSDLPLGKREDILKALAKLKMKVLWKFEVDDLPNKPSNVMIRKWLPQQDILAHPNVKLFITHGGLLSTTEAIYHGVPIIGIPFFGDQKYNMQENVRKGFAIQINFKELNEETLTNALNSILKDENYTRNVKKRSFIMHDRPMSGLDTAVYWVEYVLRHKGAHHLKTSAIDLTWYQYYLVDVLLFLAIVAILPMMLICKLIRRCRKGRCCGKGCGSKDACNKTQYEAKSKKE